MALDNIPKRRGRKSKVEHTMNDLLAAAELLETMRQDHLAKAEALLEDIAALGTVYERLAVIHQAKQEGRL